MPTNKHDRTTMSYWLVTVTLLQSYFPDEDQQEVKDNERWVIGHAHSTYCLGYFRQPEVAIQVHDLLCLTRPFLEGLVSINFYNSSWSRKEIIEVLSYEIGRNNCFHCGEQQFNLVQPDRFHPEGVSNATNNPSSRLHPVLVDQLADFLELNHSRN